MVTKFFHFFILISFFCQSQEKYTNGTVGFEINQKTIKGYEFEIYQTKKMYCIYLKKRLDGHALEIKDSIIILKKTVPKNYFFATEGELNTKKMICYNLPAIVKKTVQYEGDFYKKIYRCWYYDLLKEKIIEIKLPNKNYKVYDQSHD